MALVVQLATVPSLQAQVRDDAAAPRPETGTALPAPDPMAERLRACTGCHGREGRAAADGYYPRIAGKPAGYLAAQLDNFLAGRRHYAPMSGLLAPLDARYRREIADWFAGLRLPYPAPQPPTAAPSVLARGRQLALEGDPSRQLPACSACHGDALLGVQPAIPGLLGLPRDYLNGQFGAWREGNRRAPEPDCMGEIARRLGPDDIAAAAQWLAAQPVPVLAEPAARPAKPLPLACSALPGAERAR